MKLSEREIAIAERYGEGRTHKDISAELNIAPSTVRNHLAAVYRKLRVKNKPELIRELAARKSEFGILPPLDTAAATAPLLRSLDRKLTLSNVGASIAVLPFATVGAPELSHIGYGISADIHHDLTRSGELFVSGRSSSLVLYEVGEDAGSIARKLGVQYILQGKLRSDSRKIRITAELVHGRSGAVLWSQRYDRAMNEIMEVEAEITAEIAAGLSLQIENAQFASRRHLEGSELTAYDLRLRGNRLLEYGGLQNLKRARDHFSRAINLDPRAAAAYAGLSMCYGYECDLLLAADYDRSLARHLDLAAQAIAIDELDSRGHYAMACALMLDGRFELADSHAARSMELNPGEYHNICNRGYSLLSLGCLKQSVALFSQSLRRNPLAPNSCLLAVGLIEYLAANYGQAAHALSIMTGYRLQRASTIAAACAQMGYEKAAVRAARQFDSLSRNIPIRPAAADVGDWRIFWHRAYPYLTGDAFEHVAEGLRKASLPV